MTTHSNPYTYQPFHQLHCQMLHCIEADKLLESSIIGFILIRTCYYQMVFIWYISSMVMIILLCVMLQIFISSVIVLKVLVPSLFYGHLTRFVDLYFGIFMTFILLFFILRRSGTHGNII